MGIRRSVLALSVVDCIAFIGLWAVNGVKQANHHAVVPALSIGYWVAALIGLCIGVYGFLGLTKSRGGKDMYGPVVSVLFAIAPACGAIISLFSHLGMHPVGS